MNKAYLFLTLLSILNFQSGCSEKPDENAAPAKPATSESPKASSRSARANTGDQPAKSAMPESARITLAIAPPGVPDRVKAGAPLDLVCRITADPSGWEPDVVIFQISPERNKQLSLGSIAANKPARQDQAFSFTAGLKAPERAGSYVVDAKVLGVDPTVPNPGPPPAPAADGTRGKAGARVEFQAPSLKIKVIE